MASEYLKWKYRDVKPREKVELTPGEKRKNWWHYHKWHVVIGVALAGFLITFVLHALGVGRTDPDYRVTYVGTAPLPEDTAAAIENAFASLGEDLDGDGVVSVRILQYVSAGEMDAAASKVTLMADLMSCESYFFLLEDPVSFQADYETLRRLDGSLPEEGDASAQDTCLGWTQCPALAAMELGDYSYSLPGETVTGSSDELASKLYLARRGFWTEQTTPYPEGCDALWDRLTAGAVY